MGVIYLYSRTACMNDPIWVLSNINVVSNLYTYIRTPRTLLTRNFPLTQTKFNFPWFTYLMHTYFIVFLNEAFRH
jgi:hypothetical protein